MNSRAARNAYKALHPDYFVPQQENNESNSGDLMVCTVSGLAVPRVIISSGPLIQQFLTKSAVHVRVI
jgi:hypothetical protein